MASLIDSEAVFAGRLKACGLDGYEAGFRARGWTTLSTFAFSSSWTPGTGDDTNFVEKVVKAILPSETHVDVPKLRKLYFEAYAMVAADLKAKLDSGPDADGQKLRRLAVVERKARWGEIKTRYPHMSFTEQLEPAHQVIDKFHSMRMEGELRYIAPHEIPTREQEMKNVRTEELIKRDATGHLKAHDESKIPEADVRTDLRMRQAYSRRGVALEIADIMTMTVHERLIEKLFMEYQREPPPGYAPVSLRQLGDADMRLWKLMIEKMTGDLGRDSSGERLADKALREAMQEPAFLTMLMPLPGRSLATSAYPEKEHKDEEVAVGAGKRRLQKENAKLRERLKAAESSSWKQEEKKQKVQPEVKKMPIKMPKELWGLQPMKNKERICYGYQMSSCKQTGEKCDKGLHICMKCWKKDHGAMQCPS